MRQKSLPCVPGGPWTVSVRFLILLHLLLVPVCDNYVWLSMWQFFYNYFHFFLSLHLGKHFENVSLSSGSKGKLRAFIVLRGQIMGARHGGGPETHRHSQEEDKTQRDRTRPLGHLSHLIFAGFSLLQGLFQICILSTRICLESALCQAGC